MKPTTFPAAWAPLLDFAGGVLALAAELGVSRRTLHHWAIGDRTPGRHAREAVALWAKRRKLPSPWGAVTAKP